MITSNLTDMAAGTLPSGDLCAGSRVPLAGFFLSHNNLTGSLDVSDCVDLVLLDASFNNLTGENVVTSRAQYC